MSAYRSDWETPQDLYDRLDAEFHFTLDAAADDSNHKCDTYITKEQDGLSQPWGGIVWCNPPYGRQISKWVRKAFLESVRGVTTVMLLPARTDVRWFHEYVMHRAEIRFLRGRVRFGGSAINAPFSSMIVIYRGIENHR